MFYQQQQLTTKELNYLSDSMKNEGLMAKLCAQSAGECQNSQLKMTLEHMAQMHLQGQQLLLNTLQQQS